MQPTRPAVPRALQDRAPWAVQQPLAPSAHQVICLACAPIRFMSGTIVWANANRANRKRALAGFFQDSAGQRECTACESRGDFFQELPAQSSCDRCPANTQLYRDLGLANAVNRTACVCKKGATKHELVGGLLEAHAQYRVIPIVLQASTFAEALLERFVHHVAACLHCAPAQSECSLLSSVASPSVCLLGCVGTSGHQGVAFLCRAARSVLPLPRCIWLRRPKSMPVMPRISVSVW